MNATTQGRSRLGRLLRSKRNALLALGVVALAACAVPPPPPAPPPPPPPPSSVVFDGSPGTNAPPATLGSFTMVPFAADARPLSTDVGNVAGPTGTLGFGSPQTHLRIGSGWSSWSNGYKGDVYYTKGATSLTLTLPANTGAFAFYVEPNNFAVFNVTATAQDGTTSGAVPVNGLGGAKYFGFFAKGNVSIMTVTVSSPTAFAVGEFAIAANVPMLTGLSDVHTWVIDKRLAFHAAPLDVLTQFVRNGTPVATGIARCITDLPLLPPLAQEVVVPWYPFAPVAVHGGDVLSLRVSTRFGTNPDDTPCQGADVHGDSLRLLYDGTHQPSRFGMTITPDGSTDLYLHSDGTSCGLFDSFHVSARTLDSNPPTADASKCKDSLPVAPDNGNPYQYVGEWFMAPRP